MDAQPIQRCCAPIVDQALGVPASEELAGGYKVLADPVRLRLLSLIATAADGEVCACDLPAAVDRSQPTVSHHLSVLAEAGLVHREQRGRWAWFSVDHDRLAVLADALGLRRSMQPLPEDAQA